MKLFYERAFMFAAGAHAAVEQRRKYTDEPYIVHPVEVAQIVMETLGWTEEMVQAALLHDVVEDTGIDLLTVEHYFGPIVADFVNGLTKITKPEDGNRAHRMAIERDFLAKQCTEVQTIKLADLLSNTKSITECDPDFAKRYMSEKRELLAVLMKGDRGLWGRAKILVDDYFS